MAAISIDWAALIKVAEVSLAFGIGVVAVFALGVVGLSRLEGARENPSGSSARATGFALAGSAFLLCAAAVLYGIYLIVPQFHR